MGEKFTAFAQVAWIANIGTFRFRNWLERGQITLDAETPGGTGIARKFTLFDAIRIAIISRLVGYGMEVQIANAMVRALFSSTPVEGYLFEFRRGGLKPEPDDPEKFLAALKNEVWALSRQWTDKGGSDWTRLRLNKETTPRLQMLDSYVTIDVGAVAKNVIERWKVITEKES